MPSTAAVLPRCIASILCAVCCILCAVCCILCVVCAVHLDCASDEEYSRVQ